MQIFRDDTRRRWRRLQVAFVAALIALVVVSILFVKTLRPRPAAVLAPAPVAASIDLDAVRTEAVQAARANPRKAVEVTAGIAASSPAAAMAGADSSNKTPKALRVGFIDATEEEAIHSIVTHGDQLTHVAIECLHVRDAEGGVLGQIPDDALAAAKKQNLKVLEVVDDVRDDVPRPRDVNALGSDRMLARRFASALDAKLHADGAAGVILALGEDEGDLDGSLRAVVVEEVFARLKPSGLTVAVRFDGRFAPDAMAKQAKIAELVFVRAFNGVDPKSSPLPLAPRAWVEGTIEAASKIVPANKLVIELATRAGAWPVKPQGLVATGPARELQWAEVIARARTAGVRPTWDKGSGNLVVALPGHTGIASSEYVRAYPGDGTDEAMVVWFGDAATMADGLALMEVRNLKNVALDNLGGEDPRVWAILQTPRDDREAVRVALAKIAHPEEPDVIGEGVAMKVDQTQHDGATTIEFAVGGRIETETYDTLPASPTVVRRGKVPSKTIVFTFDDGPTAEFTPGILDALKAEGVHATFFSVGSQAEREPELLRRLVAEGHELGNHSFSHPDLGKITEFDADLQINSTNRLFEALTGKSTVLFRPPFRSDDRPTVKEDLLAIQYGERNGMITVTSQIDPHDWARPETDVIVNYVVRRAEKLDGGVVLMHDGGGDRKNTVAAIRPLIQTLRSRGFKFAQIHEIFGDDSIAVVNPAVGMKLDFKVSRVVWWGGTWILRGMTGLAIFALLLGSVRFMALGLGSLLQWWKEGRERKAIRRTSRLPNHSAVSVIIPAYNEAKVIERTILSVLASRGVEVEVLVMDDGSTDNTSDVVSQAFYFEPRVKLVKLENGGKARALNEGFKIATHDIVIALDADTIFLPDTIVELARKFDDPLVAAVAGRAAVGNTQHFVARWQAVEYIIGQAIERRAWHLLGVVSVVPGAVGAWHREAVLECGGFGTDTLAEDCDLTISLQVAGYKVGYAPDAVALTEAPESVRALVKQRFRWCFGVMQTVWKHKGAMLRPNKNNRRIGLLLMPAILFSHLLTPLLAPLADLAMIGAIALGHTREIVPYAILLVLAELFLTLLAFRIDRSRISLLWDWLVNRAVYRWFLFAALTRAVFAALRGGAVGWGKLVRTGTVQSPTTANGSRIKQAKVTA